MKKYRYLLLSASIALAIPSIAQAELSSMQEKVKVAMKLDYRTDADTKRDRNRNPVGALEFFGLKDNMKVIEFAPGGGWYTKILAPVLKDNGQLYLASNERWLNSLDPILQHQAASKAIKFPIDMGWNSKEARYELGVSVATSSQSRDRAVGVFPPLFPLESVKFGTIHPDVFHICRRFIETVGF